MPTLGRRTGSAEEPRAPGGDPRSLWKTRAGAEPRPAAQREAGASSDRERPLRKTRFRFWGRSTGDSRRDLEGGARGTSVKRGLAMPRGKMMGKPPGNTARQLLFTEALRQQKHPPVKDPKDPPPHCHINTGNMEEGPQGASMDRILQEISAVGRKLEGMDSAMLALTAETRSMRLEIAGFQSQISGLDQRVATVETQVASWTDNGQELMHLRSKLTDLEDRSRRNNICLMGLPEGM
ncbi:hypothetical protein NDU88_008454 [Pleurodeles waltl]|uniref:Uncharacterized protein n=1 Tax=Pleurodeles waltl TaxID=8319 RepID=A0AAV7QRT2_PLEWA|nr:hypothetical protein NDU88_008454 [Pleurodeles waltl]